MSDPLPVIVSDIPHPPLAVIACNRCGMARAGNVHPCAGCGCYEYRLTGTLAIEANRAGRLKERRPLARMKRDGRAI